jgi:hypothetical protein
LDANFVVVLDVRAYTQWLNIMQQLVLWEDVPFMSGNISANKLMFVLNFLEPMVSHIRYLYVMQ